MLVDTNGCPRDVSIMGPVEKVVGTKKVVQAPFDAFKFPTSGIVQFRALVVPCVPRCDPVQCSTMSMDGIRQNLYSFGRRKRDVADSFKSNISDNELIVINSIEIIDNFPFTDHSKNESYNNYRGKHHIYN